MISAETHGVNSAGGNRARARANIVFQSGAQIMTAASPNTASWSNDWGIGIASRNIGWFPKNDVKERPKIAIISPGNPPLPGLLTGSGLNLARISFSVRRGRTKLQSLGLRGLDHPIAEFTEQLRWRVVAVDR